MPAWPRSVFGELPKPQSNEWENRAFWEAYFSNFIEGTKFTVEEARVIVYDPEAAKVLEKNAPMTLMTSPSKPIG